MLMKRYVDLPLSPFSLPALVSPLVLLLLLALFLSACGVAAPVRSVYTASGDGTKPDDLTRTTTFNADDDLNVVVTLNAHSRELAVHAVFTDPAGTVYETDVIEADETVANVVLGLDWEARLAEPWPTGEWAVEIFVGGDREKSTKFKE